MLRALRALRLGWLLAVGSMAVLFLVYQSGMMDPGDAMKSVGGFIGGLAVLIWIAGYFKWRETARFALKSYPTSPRALIRKTVLFQPLCFLVFSGGFAVVLLRLWYVQLRSTSVSIDQLLTLAVGALGLGLLAATDLLVRATRATYFPPPQKQHLRARLGGLRRIRLPRPSWRSVLGAVILIVIVGHYLWLALIYGVAGAYSGQNPLNVLRRYGPAYLTAIGTMSSAATLAVSLQCAEKAEPLRKDMVRFGIPLFANIHLCGSVLTEVFFCMTISQMLYGFIPNIATMVLFCLLLGIFALGAPGVPGGTVMASLGLVAGVLGFDATGTALILTIFALQDSFGTACNVTGDGALTLFLSGYADKKGIAEVTESENIF